MSGPTTTRHCAYPWQQMIIDLTGEVVPCCFWAGYGNTGKPLGNTNESTLDEIWRGEAYRALRETVASGDLEGHPCGSCMAYRWGNGTFPRFTWPTGFTHQEGFCFFGQIDENFERAATASGEPIVLCEDGVPLATADAPHADIRAEGAGRYSVWKGWIYFSSSDNSDPTNNGRSYELRCGELTSALGGLVKDSESGRNLLLAHEEHRKGVADITAEPSMISFISTADCNIDCPACSQNIVRVTKVQHRPETGPDVLSKVPYLAQFIWHGGEPYLIKDFRAFIDGYATADNPNLAFGFTSNGTQITTKEAEKLLKFPRVNASVSCDSFVRETFEEIRAGADYDRVVGHIKELLKLYNAPQRVFSVGMIICKSNMAELAENLAFAIDHDIPLNLSPVVIYPPSEQLNVFEDFKRQTRGWAEALERARAVTERAKAEGRLSVRRIDPSGMIEEIAAIFAEASRRYAQVRRFPLRIEDPTGSLKACRFPAAVMTLQDQLLAYVMLEPGREDYCLHIPHDIRLDGLVVRVDVLESVMEPGSHAAMVFLKVDGDQLRIVNNGFIPTPPEPPSFLGSGARPVEAALTRVRDRLQRSNILSPWVRRDREDYPYWKGSASWNGRVAPVLEVTLAEFRARPRGRNIARANYGVSTPEGHQPTEPGSVHTQYSALFSAERAAHSGHWRFASKSATRRMRQNVCA